MIRILVVEDDEKLNQIVCTYLNDSGFQAKGCLSAAAAYEEMYHTVYQLIISDIMMPEIDGFEFAGTVRRINETIPILFMSAKDDLPSKRKGFQLGIDDYMVKPIELDELLLRVRALLRRANIEMERKITVGNLILDADAMSAEIDGEEISLTTREFNIIYKLLSYPKKTFSRAQLMDEFWGVETDTSLRAVDVYVTKLRDKLSACDGFKIVTVRGLGYKVVQRGKVKQSLFPVSLFGIYIGVLFLMSGIHTGLIVFMNSAGWNKVVMTVVPMCYWGMVAMGLTLFTRWKVKRTYEEPLYKMAEATRKVANGDFSVYVPTFHTMEKRDYLDVMILDFNKMVEELGSIETLKTDFVSNVSHEMKTPLSIIKNYAELLQRDALSEEQCREYGEAIENTAMRLSDLISNILKLNKLENQKIQPEAEVYDVCRQLCDCILQYESAWEKKEIEMEVEMEDRAEIYADQDLMELVWNNLLSNAVKFTEPGGVITVRQLSDEQGVTISVSDTGFGMSKNTMKHIFDKFYQGDTSRSKDGNGLGMAMVKRVLELMDGEIQVLSEEKQGSTFIVTLPMAGKEFG